jgi:hypothetical protein
VRSQREKWGEGRRPPPIFGCVSGILTANGSLFAQFTTMNAGSLAQEVISSVFP